MNQQRLHQRLHYDPSTGVFTWKAPEKPGQNAEGTVAGSHCDKGYLVIGIDRKVYKAHRLAWLYMTGSWPECQIDHINGVKDDNRWANLRQATNAQNCCNRTRFNSTGYRNVVRGRSGKFYAKVNFAGKRLQRGGFETAEEAAIAAAQFRHELHGDYAVA